MKLDGYSKFSRVSPGSCHQKRKECSPRRADSVLRSVTIMAARLEPSINRMDVQAIMTLLLRCLLAGESFAVTEGAYKKLGKSSRTENWKSLSRLHISQADHARSIIEFYTITDGNLCQDNCINMIHRHHANTCIHSPPRPIVYHCYQRRNRHQYHY